MNVIDSKKYVYFSDVQYIGTQIISFDVSDNEIIAVAFDNHHINILNSSGEFIEDYEVLTDGSFVIEWQQEVLYIYLFRESQILKIYQEDEGIDIIPATNTIAYNNKLLKLENMNTISKNRIQYKLKSSNSLLGAWDTLVCYDSTNTERVIVSTKKEYQNLENLHIGIIIVLLIFFVLLCFISKMESKSNP